MGRKVSLIVFLTLFVISGFSSDAGPSGEGDPLASSPGEQVNQSNNPSSGGEGSHEEKRSETVQDHHGQKGEGEVHSDQPGGKGKKGDGNKGNPKNPNLKNLKEGTLLGHGKLSPKERRQRRRKVIKKLIKHHQENSNTNTDTSNESSGGTSSSGTSSSGSSGGDSSSLNTTQDSAQGGDSSNNYYYEGFVGGSNFWSSPTSFGGGSSTGGLTDTINSGSQNMEEGRPGYGKVRHKIKKKLKELHEEYQENHQNVNWAENIKEDLRGKFDFKDLQEFKDALKLQGNDFKTLGNDFKNGLGRMDFSRPDFDRNQGAAHLNLNLPSSSNLGSGAPSGHVRESVASSLRETISNAVESPGPSHGGDGGIGPIESHAPEGRGIGDHSGTDVHDPGMSGGDSGVGRPGRDR
ncbi:MAG: hypothetical protein HYS07_05635 [Chlamydiae bacterium]|nr:hypothetical protein [Chlamydiota bacterium]MBI3276464.1 hypothetical protein [Chlamydiota bacterium]